MEFDAPTGAMAYQANSLMDAKMAYQPNMKQRLELAVKQAEDRLAAVKEAQEIFTKNPDLERLLDLMQRNHF